MHFTGTKPNRCFSNSANSEESVEMPHSAAECGICFQIEKKSVGTGIHMIRIILHVTPQNIMDDPILVVLIYVVASIGFKRLKF